MKSWKWLFTTSSTRNTCVSCRKHLCWLTRITKAISVNPISKKFSPNSITLQLIKILIKSSKSFQNLQDWKVLITLIFFLLLSIAVSLMIIKIFRTSSNISIQTTLIISLKIILRRFSLEEEGNIQMKK